MVPPSLLPISSNGAGPWGLNCAHRTSTVSSCAFCEQEGWSDSSLPILPSVRVPRAGGRLGYPPLTPNPAHSPGAVGHAGISGDYGTLSSSVVADRAAGSTRHASWESQRESYEGAGSTPSQNAEKVRQREWRVKRKNRLVSPVYLVCLVGLE